MDEPGVRRRTRKQDRTAGTDFCIIPGDTATRGPGRTRVGVWNYAGIFPDESTEYRRQSFECLRRQARIRIDLRAKARITAETVEVGLNFFFWIENIVNVRLPKPVTFANRDLLWLKYTRRDFRKDQIPRSNAFEQKPSLTSWSPEFRLQKGYVPLRIFLRISRLFISWLWPFYFLP